MAGTTHQGLRAEDEGMGLMSMQRATRADVATRATRLRWLPWGIAAGDLVVISLSVLLGWLSRTRLPWFRVAGGVYDESTQYAAIGQYVGAYIVILWMICNFLWSTYRLKNLGVGTIEYARVCTAAAATAGIIGIISYLTMFDLSRGFFILTFVIGVPLLLSWRYFARRLLHRAHLQGRLLNRVLISGTPRTIDAVASVLARELWLGYSVVGAVLPPGSTVTSLPRDMPVVGYTDALAEVATECEVDEVIIAEGSMPSAADFRRLAWELEGRHVRLSVVPSLSDISAGRMNMRPIGGLPLVSVEPPRSIEAARGLKRTFDIGGALLAILLTAPLMIFTAIWIRLHDGAPVLFRQVRVGRDGALFHCLKFRSMVTDAEEQLAKVAHLSMANGVLFKAVDDPRITKPGKFIRRYSIDELPQLFNVLRGDMSLVGPRPGLPDEVRRYDADVQRRLHVRPGITGLWQVSGRSNLSWEDTVRLDLYYVDNWSVVQDLTILTKTVKAVIKSDGAY